MVPLLRTPEVAALLKVSRRQVSLWVRDGRLRAIKFGTHAVRFEPAEIERFVRRFKAAA